VPQGQRFENRIFPEREDIVSGPLGFQVPCISNDPGTGARQEGLVKVDSITDFGSTTEVLSQEGGAVFTRAASNIFLEITRTDASLTEIPFTISDITLQTLQFNESSAFFDFLVTDLTPADPQAPVVSRQRGTFTLSERGDLAIDATDQAGFEAAFVERSDIPVSVKGPGAFGQTTTNNSATFEATVRNYTSALDISDLVVGEEYELNYFFGTQVVGRFAKANFQDPFELGTTGGLDPIVLAALTGGTVPLPAPTPVVPGVSAVPLPASAWFMLWALGGLCVAKQVNRTRSVRSV
jgi:hypothetical protein